MRAGSPRLPPGATDPWRGVGLGRLRPVEPLKVQPIGPLHVAVDVPMRMKTEESTRFLRITHDRTWIIRPSWELELTLPALDDASGGPKAHDR